jgi:hypothetical protein
LALSPVTGCFVFLQFETNRRDRVFEPAKSRTVETVCEASENARSGESRRRCGNIAHGCGTAAVGTDDEALKVALLDAANDNRVAEYGDDYMMGWAKDLLGVGDAFGKIGEVRETLEPASEWRANSPDPAAAGARNESSA